MQQKTRKINKVDDSEGFNWRWGKEGKVKTILIESVKETLSQCRDREGGGPGFCCATGGQLAGPKAGMTECDRGSAEKGLEESRHNNADGRD